jgi:predicted ATPase
MAEVRKKTLRIAHLHLENWRNFLHVDIPLERRVFLVGPNASGKSNFLDALRFLHDLVSVGGGFREAVRKRGGVSRLRCLAARLYSDIVLRIQLVEADSDSVWEYALHFKQDNRQRPSVKKETVVYQGLEILQRPDADDSADPERLSQTHLEQVNVNRDFRLVADFLATIRYLHIVPQLVREPDRSVGKQDDPFGGDFLEQIARTPNNILTARLRRIEGALRIAVPQLEKLEFWRDERGKPHLRGKYEHWRPQGAWQAEDQFSDGTLRLLGLLWAVLDGTGPLLLEEPELSLHPEVIRYLPQIFARIQTRVGRQIFLSTHSTDLLRDEGIGIDEVLLLKPSAEGTDVKAASSYKDVRVLLEKGGNIAEVVMPITSPMGAEQLALFGKN